MRDFLQTNCSLKVGRLLLSWLLLFLLFPQGTEACYGGRPLGMGGAYVAVAQGAEAIYWNPGGVVFATGPTLSLTQTIPPGSVNYQSFLGMTFSHQEIALGLGYTGLADYVYDRYWWQMVTSIKIRPWLGLGLERRLIKPWRGDDYQETDLGFQAHWERLSIGLLVQSIDTPGYNIRPGIALQGRNSLFAVDIYDLTNNHDAFSINLGFEYNFPSTLDLRLGLYGLGSAKGHMKTFGLGKTFDFFTLDGVCLVGNGFTSYQVTAGYRF